MRDYDDDNLNDGPADAEGLDADLVSLLDRLGAAERAEWRDADSARVASATVGLIAAEERAAVAGSIGPGGARPTKRWAGGMGWLAGLAAAAVVGLVVGVGVMLSQPGGATGGGGGPLVMNTTNKPVALDDAALEEELSAWLAGRVRVDAVALLSTERGSDSADSAWERDSLDELEIDLAAFWTMRSGLTSVDDDGFEAEGTL